MSCTVFSQNLDVDSRIREVFGEQAEELVFSDTDRYQFIKDLIQNRIEFISSSESADEKYPKLSQVLLLDKYNQTLQRDTTIDPEEFNVLKYNVNLTSSHTVVYRIDHTDWLLVIHPQKKN